MGTILFLVLKLTGQLSTEADLAVLCVLISIDTVGLLTFLNCKKKG